MYFCVSWHCITVKECKYFALIRFLWITTSLCQVLYMFCMFVPRVPQIQIPSFTQLMSTVSLLSRCLCSFTKWAGLCQVFHTVQPAWDFTYFIWHFFGFHKYTQLRWLLFSGSSVNHSQSLSQDSSGLFLGKDFEEIVVAESFHVLHCSDTLCSVTLHLF